MLCKISCPPLRPSDLRKWIVCLKVSEMQLLLHTLEKLTTKAVIDLETKQPAVVRILSECNHFQMRQNLELKK